MRRMLLTVSPDGAKGPTKVAQKRWKKRGRGKGKRGKEMNKNCLLVNTLQ